MQSLPLRGAWIEIPDCEVPRRLPGVAPPTGSVDQNTRKLSSDHHRECIGMADGASLVLFLILLRLAEGMRFNIQENAMTVFVY